MKFALIIPTLNAGRDFAELLEQAAEQTRQPAQKLVIDSSSVDNTVAIAAKHGWKTKVISPKEFNHGLTRQAAWKKMLAFDDRIKIAVYLTQDVRFCDNRGLENLLAAFDDDRVGAAYGRQLPHKNASLAAVMQREFSYPAQSRRKTLDDAPELGIRAPFLSDAFAAYRLSALDEIGGFPLTDICEDMYVGGKLLLAGWAIKYEASAMVYHSHDFDFRQNLDRYLAIGAFQRKNSWLGERFGKSEGAGVKLLQSQLKTAWDKRNWKAAGEIVLADAVKFLAYRVGYYRGR